MIGEAAFGQLVVDHFTDQRGVDGIDFAADDTVFDRLGDADGHGDGEIGFVENLLNDPLAVPGQGDFGGAGLDEEQAGIGDVDTVFRVAADADGATGNIALFAIPLIGGNNQGLVVVGQKNFHQVLNIFDQRDALIVTISVNIKLGPGVAELFDHLRGDFLGETFVARGAFFAGNLLHCVVDGHFNFFLAERDY